MLDLEQRVKELDKQIIVMGVIDTPASILVGLGLYAKFAANGDAFWPLLNSELVANSMLGSGAAIMLLCGVKVVSLVLEKARIGRQA